MDIGVDLGTANVLISMGSKGIVLNEPSVVAYNKKTEELFYYPLASDNMETAEVYIPKSEMLLSVSGTEENSVENITFKGILMVSALLNPSIGSTGIFMSFTPMVNNGFPTCISLSK